MDRLAMRIVDVSARIITTALDASFQVFAQPALITFLVKTEELSQAHSTL